MRTIDKIINRVDTYRGRKRLPIMHGYDPVLFSGTGKENEILRLDKESARLLQERDQVITFERLYPYGWREAKWGMHEGVEEPVRPCSYLDYTSLGLKYYRFVDDDNPKETFTVLALPERVEQLMEEEGELKTWSHKRSVRREMFPIDYTNADADREERIAESIEGRLDYSRF